MAMSIMESEKETSMNTPFEIRGASSYLPNDFREKSIAAIDPGSCAISNDIAHRFDGVVNRHGSDADSAGHSDFFLRFETLRSQDGMAGTLEREKVRENYTVPGELLNTSWVTSLLVLGSDHAGSIINKLQDGLHTGI